MTHDSDRTPPAGGPAASAVGVRVRHRDSLGLSVWPGPARRQAQAAVEIVSAECTFCDDNFHRWKLPPARPGPEAQAVTASRRGPSQRPGSLSLRLTLRLRVSRGRDGEAAHWQAQAATASRSRPRRPRRRRRSTRTSESAGRESLLNARRGPRPPTAGLQRIFSHGVRPGATTPGRTGRGPLPPAAAVARRGQRRGHHPTRFSHVSAAAGGPSRGRGGGTH